MEILFKTESGEYFIQSNGKTFFIMDDCGTCREATTSAVKAKNVMNRILNCVNISERVQIKDLK